MDTLFLVLIVVAAVWLYALYQRRAAGGKCPRCGTALPFFRKPSSVNEGLWGGWTCANCGAKIDRSGKERAA